MFSLSHVNLLGRIENISLHFEAGQQWHVLGQNGAGKSSLLTILAGLEQPDSGEVLFNGLALSEQTLPLLAQQRCFLQQQQATAFDIPIAQLLKFYTQQERLPERLESCLQLQPLLDKPLSVLSGGQQQRFNIARSLMQIWPSVQKGQAALLLDEPCQHLDINYQFHLMQLLTELGLLGNLIIMSSHDINLSLGHANKVVMLRNKQVVFSGDCADVLTIGNLEHVFGHKFIELDITRAQQTLVAANQNHVKYPQKYITSASNQDTLA